MGGGALLITMRCNQQPAWTDTVFSTLLHATPVYVLTVGLNEPINPSLMSPPTSPYSLLLTVAVSVFLITLISFPAPRCFLFPTHLIPLAISLFISCTFVFPLSISTTIHPHRLHTTSKPAKAGQCMIYWRFIPSTCQKQH